MKDNLLAIVLLLSLVYSSLSQEKMPSIVRITVECTTTLRALDGNPTGFCMSFINDADREGRKPFAPVLKSMNVGSLRYPMGTLAENYLFHDLRTGPPVEDSLKPCERLKPTLNGNVHITAAESSCRDPEVLRIPPVSGGLRRDHFHHQRNGRNHEHRDVIRRYWL